MSENQIQTGPTGPRTEEGKAISSRNAFKHGLASGQLIIPGENPDDYAALLSGFVSEYRPEGQTENLLLQEMAKSHWFKERAIRFQSIAWEITMPKLETTAVPDDLGVLIRCQSANERSFYRALKTLQAIQKERKAAKPEFVSQKPEKPKPAASESVTKDDLNELLVLIHQQAHEESCKTGEEPFEIERRLLAKLA
jgi:hypothetical protein